VPSATAPPSPTARPNVFYVSYDGACEPLGRSQVLPYLVRLAPTYDITLISFEKSTDEIGSLQTELEEHGIRWLPQRYHKRPPVLSTLLDVLRGRRVLIRAGRETPPAIIHVRSYVPALMALRARRRIGGKLLFDIRGFWADERVEGGLWRKGGLLYRVAKRCERQFFSQADAVVTLTHASVPQIRSWTKGRSVPIDIIPTCVDLDRFGDRPARADGPHVVWNGSLGTWYRFDLTARVAAALALPLIVVTRQPDLARQLLGEYPAIVRSAAPDDVADELFAGDIGLCLIKSSFSKIASAPTRFAEYLAVGMPVLTTGDVGDLESIVDRHRVGVVLGGEGESAIAEAAAQLRSLASDPDLRERCRRVARELFDVEAGSRHYAAIYDSLTA
jgi:glycosyltransferase involved in cell wall biosynthesis